MTHKVIGFHNGSIILFDTPQVCCNKDIKSGDILELDGDYVRLYKDGDGRLRYDFITDDVLQLLAKRHEAAIKQQAAGYIEQKWQERMEADYEDTLYSVRMGTGRR
jgi:hypothetical protein